MATQITSKHGFTENFWLQMAALVIVTLVVIALAAEYVWWASRSSTAAHEPASKYKAGLLIT
jgi:hypothetical protein